MTQVEPSSPVIVFSAAPGEPSNEVDQKPDNQAATDYFRRREQIERAAAKTAKSHTARSIHQILAQNYASLSRRRPG